METKNKIITAGISVILLIILTMTVTATTFTDASIHLNNWTINVSDCEWSFTEMKWDDGGNWLYVSDHTATGAVTVTVPGTKNYTGSGYVLCKDFGYASYPHSSDPHVDDSTDTLLNAVIIFSGFLAIVILVSIGGIVFLAIKGKADPEELWAFGVKMGIIIITTAVVVAILAYLRSST